jgi:hypothetical protein
MPVIPEKTGSLKQKYVCTLYAHMNKRKKEEKYCGPRCTGQNAELQNNQTRKGLGIQLKW